MPFWGQEAKDGSTEKIFSICEPEDALKYTDNGIKTSVYTAYDFVPRNLFFQLQKLANMYFTAMAILQLIPGLSPVTPWSSILPLLFVLFTSAAKEAYEDYQRHKSDDEINKRPAKRVQPDGKVFQEYWHDLHVGDILELHNNDPVPCDILILGTSEVNGVAYIETANLDGETNLKLKNSMAQTRENIYGAKDAAVVRGKITCEKPNDQLYNFVGTIKFSNLGGKKGAKAKKVLAKDFPITADSVLLRGCTLRNTKWLYGVVINTGPDTKLMMNGSIKKELKRSKVDYRMNKYLFIILAIQCVSVTVCAVLGATWWENIGKGHDYMMIADSSDSGAKGVELWFTFLILYSALIPISLYVSVEMVKAVHAALISLDDHMYFEETDKPAKARTSNLSEELGQVEYIFSDKTGTLTRNMMEFLKCSINGVQYGTGTTEAKRAAELREQGKDATLLPHAKPDTTTDSHEASSNVSMFDPRIFDDMEDGDNSDNIDMFMTILAVCHTVLAEKDPSAKYGLAWQAASPDEGALVEAAAMFGYVFHTRTPTSVIIDTPRGTQLEYEVLNVLEFDSDRKRMSVVVRTPDDDLLLLTKGADAVIYERLSEDEEKKEVTLDHLEEYAVEGLRTLCLAKRELDEDEYEEWASKYDEAALAQGEKRAVQIAAVSELLEVDLELVGCTAIEDKLQEGVPDCIATLAKGGIKIWVLTGDKQETAINIGFACALLTHNMDLIILNATSETAKEGIPETREKMKTAMEKFGGKSHKQRTALIMDGKTLAYALTEGNDKLLFELGSICASVIFCRVSPKQKADVVLLARKNTDAVTLAIGDGANDVSMIKEAHVGVGISGQEGMQAVLASDYAVGQFNYLQRILLVHGRWSYRRICKLILYSFYKNFAFILTQLWYNIYVGFSGQSLLDDWYIAVFNLTFTGLPIMAIATFDQDVSDRASLMFPQLYTTGPKNKEFNVGLFCVWLMDGIYQSLVLFFIPYLWFYAGSTQESGRMDGLHHFGSVVYSALCVTVNVKIVLMTESWTWINHLLTWSHLGGWYLFAILYHALFEHDFSIYDQLNCPSYWLVTFATVSLCLLPSYLYEHSQAVFFPSLVDYVKSFRIPTNKKVKLLSLSRGKEAIAALVTLGNMRAFQREEQYASYSDKDVFRNIKLHTMEGKSGDGKKFQGFGNADPSHGRYDYSEK